MKQRFLPLNTNVNWDFELDCCICLGSSLASTINLASFLELATN